VKPEGTQPNKADYFAKVEDGNNGKARPAGVGEYAAWKGNVPNPGKMDAKWDAGNMPHQGVVHNTLYMVNYGTQAQLEAVKGIGPSTAAAIKTYVADNGPIKTLTELESIKGVSSGRIAMIKEYAPKFATYQGPIGTTFTEKAPLLSSYTTKWNAPKSLVNDVHVDKDGNRIADYASWNKSTEYVATPAPAPQLDTYTGKVTNLNAGKTMPKLPAAYEAQYTGKAPALSDYVTTTVPTLDAGLAMTERPADIERWGPGYKGYVATPGAEPVVEAYLAKVKGKDKQYDIANRPNPYAKWDKSTEQASVGAAPQLLTYTDLVTKVDAKYTGANPYGDTYTAEYTGKAPTAVAKADMPKGARPKGPVGAKPDSLTFVADPGKKPAWDENGAYSWGANKAERARYYTYPTAGPATPTAQPVDPGQFTMQRPEELPTSFAGVAVLPVRSRPSSSSSNVHPGPAPFYGILPPEPLKQQFKGQQK
jgi:hypothetical protein